MVRPGQSAVSIKFETQTDMDAVRRVNTEAFGRSAEANLVDALRRQGQIEISLVAQASGNVVGHVVLSPVLLMPRVPGLRMLGLGPVAVLPSSQRRGVGSALIRQSIGYARAEGWHAVVVLGHPQDDARFGFGPAIQHQIGCEFNAPQAAFMLLELQPGTLQHLHGVVRYQPEFSLSDFNSYQE